MAKLWRNVRGANFLPDRPAVPMFDIKEYEGRK
jgi:hypothetical protein